MQREGDDRQVVALRNHKCLLCSRMNIGGTTFSLAVEIGDTTMQESFAVPTMVHRPLELSLSDPASDSGPRRGHCYWQGKYGCAR